MNNVTRLLFFLIAIPLTSLGQGTLRGVISDQNGEKLIGVTLVVKEDQSMFTQSGIDGSYNLKITRSDSVTLIVSYVSFAKIEERLLLKNNEVLIKDIVMAPSVKIIKGVEITATQKRDQNYYMENVKKKSVTTIDYISSESIKKIGDNNVGSAIGRVSGVSTNGSFFTVRGVGDRYIKTTINGSIIPTLDPFTNNIRLDLIPASLVDNLIITKTQSPDIPADWAGAYVSIETKDFPEKMLLNVETTLGYNPQSTLTDVISSQRSNTDWLGFDNSLRDRTHDGFIKTSIEPTLYQYFAALGFKDYYNTMGVDQNTWVDGSTTSDTYFKLGLIKLGLLAPALFNDASAFNAAKEAFYNGSYTRDAFKIINKNAAEQNASLPNNWNTPYRRTPLNFSQSFSIGNQTKIGTKKLGYLFSFRYSSSNQYDAEAVSQRARFDQSLAQNLEQGIARESNGWNGLASLSFSPNKNNSFSLLFMPNLIGINNIRNGYERVDQFLENYAIVQFYEQRKQLVYQLKTEHYLPGLKLKIRSNASYTRGKSTAPDFRNLTFTRDPSTNEYQFGPSVGEGIHRYFRYLNENQLDVRLQFELPLSTADKSKIRKMKWGGSYVRLDRYYDQYDYMILNGPYGSTLNILTTDNVSDYFNTQSFLINEGINNEGKPYTTIYQYYNQIHFDGDETFGYSAITSAFLMTDYAINSLWKVSGGVRMEYADLFTDVVTYYEAGYAANDVRRDYSQGSYPLINPGVLKKLNILPSVNMLYVIRDDDKGVVNFRANYSQSVARPSLRELSDVAIIDYEFRTFTFGNSNLQPVNISNYDVRLESFQKDRWNWSVSLFYKQFRNHIELINAGTVTWENVDRSRAAGIELEGKLKLMKNLDWMTNLTLVNSNTTFVRKRMELSSGNRIYIPLDTVSRVMFGQAPYIINSSISYANDKNGWTGTLSYNIQGKRLIVASNVKEIPDVFEFPRNLIDIKVSKRITKHFSTYLSVRDLLNTYIRRSYDYQTDVRIDFDRFRFGTTYILGIIYKL